MMRDKGSQHAMMQLIESRNSIGTINKLIKPYGQITQYDNWMPKSFHNHKEAELKDFLKYNFSPQLGANASDWWLKVKHSKATTPNWDFISTCTINNKRGILLVEAKAHEGELEGESGGKKLKKEAGDNSVSNHKKIGSAIQEASLSIQQAGYPVAISRDKCYQLSNRVAHAWWLANNDIPVVLMYLGFLNCKDMDYGKRILLDSSQQWKTFFLNHAKQVGVETLIDKWVKCSKSEFITICRGYDTN